MSAHAYTAYARHQADGLSGRALEAAILERAALDLHGLVQSSSRPHPTMLLTHLQRNREIWSLFAMSVLEEQRTLPQDMRTNILSLALFVEAQMRKAMVDADVTALEPIIYINRHLAAGLRGYSGTELPPLPSSSQAVQPLEGAAQ